MVVCTSKYDCLLWNVGKFKKSAIQNKQQSRLDIKMSNKNLMILYQKWTKLNDVLNMTNL